MGGMNAETGALFSQKLCDEGTDLRVFLRRVAVLPSGLCGGLLAVSLLFSRLQILLFSYVFFYSMFFRISVRQVKTRIARQKTARSGARVYQSQTPVSRSSF